MEKWRMQFFLNGGEWRYAYAAIGVFWVRSHWKIAWKQLEIGSKCEWSVRPHQWSPEVRGLARWRVGALPTAQESSLACRLVNAEVVYILRTSYHHGNDPKQK